MPIGLGLPRISRAAGCSRSGRMFRIGPCASFTVIPVSSPHAAWMPSMAALTSSVIITRPRS